MRMARPGPVQVRVDRGVGSKAVLQCPRPRPGRRFGGRFRKVATLKRVRTQAAGARHRVTLDLRLPSGLYRITVRAHVGGKRLSRPLRRYLRVLQPLGGRASGPLPRRDPGQM
jgi:hypothetical protein